MYKITIKSLILLLGLFFLNLGQAQTLKYRNIDPNVDNFYEIVNETRNDFKILMEAGPLSKKEEKALKQFERWAYVWKDRINPDGSFPTAANHDDYKNVILNELNQNQTSREATSEPWTIVGPTNNVTPNGYTAYPGMGRINVVDVDPTNANIMYAGAAAGGLWKSTTGGTSWTPLTDTFAGLGVTDMLIDPTDTSIIYIATGDEDGRHIPSIGVFKSTDAGATWAATGLTFNLSDQDYIRDLAFFPGNSTKIFALTNTEIRMSADSGAAWSNATVTYPYSPFTEAFQSIIFDPNDSSKVVVSDFWSGLYYSTDAGLNFAMHDFYQGGNNKDVLKLTATPIDTENFYAIDQGGTFRKYRFDFDNTSADEISNTTINGFNSQGGYNIAITVSPTDANNMMIAGVRGYKSTDGGASFSVLLNPYNNPPGVGFYVHPDHHFLKFIDGTTLLDGHDGGVHKGAFTATSGWTDLSNGLVITQAYNIAITQDMNGDDFMMANQDNDGFAKTLLNGTRQWTACLAGDGTSTAIDYTNPLIRYLGGTMGALDRSDNGFATYFGTTILSSDNNAAFVSPLSMHPTVPATIYAGHSDIKKSTDYGNSFTALNTGLTGITFIDLVQNNSSIRIYTIGNEGAKRSDDDGATWTSVGATGGTINSFAAQPNSNVVYATVSGYTSGSKVFKSTDAGATWTNISGSLPNIVMKRIILKVDNTDETLFLGTELGVYWKNSTMTDWEKLGTGLPNVIVSDLKINYTDQLLYIGTFGRGMWKTAVDTNALGVESNFDLDEMPVIFPNPIVNQEFNIELPYSLQNLNGYKYTIFNVVGGIVQQGDINQHKTIIRTDAISAGFYLVKIYHNSKAMIKKVIIK